MSLALFLLAALDRNDFANYVNGLFTVYIILVFIRVLISWIPRMPYNRVLSAVVDFVHQTTDPYLNFFRRFLPPVGGGRMMIDLSPIIGIILLLIGQGVVVGLIAE